MHAHDNESMKNENVYKYWYDIKNLQSRLDFVAVLVRTYRYFGLPTGTNGTGSIGRTSKFMLFTALMSYVTYLIGHLSYDKMYLRDLVFEQVSST